MNVMPAVFVSYSNSAGPEQLINEVVTRAKAVLEELKWNIVDPLDEPDMRAINEKVCTALRGCDALLFIWAGNTNPNIAFEAGFAEALGLPIIIAKRKDAGELFADLKNREYISYPEKAENTQDLNTFKNNLRELLQKIGQTALSDAARELHQGAREVLTAIRDQTPLSLINDPLVFLKVGWLKEIKRILIQNDVFEVDTHYYPNCLLELRNWAYHKEILAIADISNGTEFFGATDRANLGLAIKERIFVIDWNNLFDWTKLEYIQKSLSRHLLDTDSSSSYKVYVVPNVYTVMKSQTRHPLGENAKSLDVLIIDDKHVAGYVRTKKFGDQRINFQARSLPEPEVGTARQFFHDLLSEAVEFDSSESVEDLRRKLLRKYSIGHWIPGWKVLRDRPGEYFDLYDQHIRCWIPEYDRLLEVCQAVVHREAMRLTSSLGRAISVLELGVGTGALTKRVADGFIRLNKAGSTIREFAVKDYFGIDQIPRMLELAEEKIEPLRKHKGPLTISFDRRDFWTDDLPAVEIVFGSLVLHFLLEGDVSEEHVTRCFKRLVDAVTPGGSVVFAGIMPAEDMVVRERHFSYWRNWMETRGLDEEEIEEFFQHNDVLSDTADFGRVIKCAEAAGLTQRTSRARDDTGVGVGDRDSPFGVICFSKPIEKRVQQR